MQIETLVWAWGEANDRVQWLTSLSLSLSLSPFLFPPSLSLCLSLTLSLCLSLSFSLSLPLPFSLSLWKRGLIELAQIQIDYCIYTHKSIFCNFLLCINIYKQILILFTYTNLELLARGDLQFTSQLIISL